jgi:zinc/manganese transport system substrate-binding protein
VLTVGLALIVLLGACSDDGVPEGLTVVATTTILGDVVANVVGGDAEVVVLAPLGADPHDFQPSSAQVATINEADLVVANGLSLEEGLEDILDGAASDGANVIELAPQLDPLPFGSGDDSDSQDPHVWLDPVRMGDAARLIASKLTAIDGSVDWNARADAYAAELAALDGEIEAMLAAIPEGGRLLVTNHDSLGYFAARYEFNVIGTVIPGGTTLADPSSEALAELVSVMETAGVTAIFAETTLPAVLAEAVAAELGSDVEVVSLYTGSLGEAGSGAETLIDMLRTNAERIAEGLGK